MHQQPILNKMGVFEREHYPVSEYLYHQGLYIPSGLALEESQMEKVVSAIADLHS